MIVRPATPDDIDNLIALAKPFHKESVLAFPSPDEAVMRESLEMLIANVALCLFVAEDEGRIVGGLNGSLSRYFFSDALIASHDVIYVLPNKRGTWAAYRLVQAFEDWAVEKGVWEVRIATHTGINTERTERFFTRMGYEHLGGTFRKVF